MSSGFSFGHLGLLSCALVATLLAVLLLYALLVREARARARSESWLRDVTESVPAAVFRLRRHADGRMEFEFVSHNVEEIRGVSRETLLADRRAALANVLEEDRVQIAGAIVEAGMLMRPYERRYRVRHPDGRVRWVAASARPRPEPDGSVLWHGYWADVTSRRELEDQLVSAKDRAERASQAKSDFLAAMSHEIRTPMTGVVGMVELLALEDLRDEQRLSVGIIRESSAALLRIIDDVLDWSRIEAGKFELRMAPATLDAIVARVAGLYAAVATNKGLRLERTLDPSLRDAYMVDAVRVQQVLSNLISNAVKFTDRGEVRVGLALIARGPRADIVAFDVCDTGAGISAEDQSRLFAAYSQVGDAAARTGGTGLGLSISRRLAELMGGSLSLESKPGGGTRARLVLPVSHAHRPASPAAPGDRPLCLAVDNSGRPRILLIDDDEVTRVVMQRQLAALGYVVEATSSAQEALQRCESTRFAAILVDCSMPSMDGYEFTRRLRAREQQRGRRRTAVIACTACVFEEDVRASREAGMDDHLRKPTDLDQLGTMLRRWTAPPGEDTTHA